MTHVDHNREMGNAEQVMAEPNGNFAGKIAVVTGAGTGIGCAAALAFPCEGASAVPADVSFQVTIESLDCPPTLLIGKEQR